MLCILDALIIMFDLYFDLQSFQLCKPLAMDYEAVRGGTLSVRSEKNENLKTLVLTLTSFQFLRYNRLKLHILF